jgi:hypothetical protein
MSGRGASAPPNFRLSGTDVGQSSDGDWGAAIEADPCVHFQLPVSVGFLTLWPLVLPAHKC